MWGERTSWPGDEVMEREDGGLKTEVGEEGV
jgi:hypothetical protein